MLFFGKADQRVSPVLNIFPEAWVLGERLFKGIIQKENMNLYDF